MIAYWWQVLRRASKKSGCLQSIDRGLLAASECSISKKIRSCCLQEPVHAILWWPWARVAQTEEFLPGVRYILSNGTYSMNSATGKSYENADFNFEHPRLNLKSCISNRIAYHGRGNAWSTRLCSKSLELFTGMAINNFRWFASTLIIVNLNSASWKYNICLGFLSFYIKTSNTSLINIHQ